MRDGAGGSEAGGVLWLLGALFVITCMDAGAKALSAGFAPEQVLWARFTAQSVVVGLALAPSIRRRIASQFTRRMAPLQALRAGLMLAGNLFFFKALAVMPLGDAAAVFQVGPLLITALAALVLGEAVGLRRWLAVAVGLIGALIIIRPGGEVFSWSSLFPLAAAACYAGYSISLRWRREGADPETTLVVTSLLVALGASALVPFHWTTPDLAQTGLMIFVGLFGAAAQFGVIMALSQARASTLAPFNYTQLVWAMLFSIFWFGDLPDGWTLVGCAVIVGSGLYVWRRERDMRRPPYVR